MGNCISPLFDNMGTCISKCMPKRPSICCKSAKSSPVQDKLVISEIRSTAPRRPAGRENVFSDEFLIACMKNNFHLATQLVPIPKPAHASRSKVCTEASSCLVLNPQHAKLGYSYSPSSQQAMLIDPEKVLLFPSCPDRHLPASPSVGQRYTANTSCASSYASTSSSRNITRHDCRIKEVKRVSVPSCSSRCSGTTSMTGSNLGISSSSRRKVGKPASGSVDCNSSSASNSSCSNSLSLRRKEICRHEDRFDSSKGSAVGIKEDSSRLLKRKKGEKAVHPISCEDIDGDASSDSLASAIDINNSLPSASGSVDCNSSSASNSTCSNSLSSRRKEIWRLEDRFESSKGSAVGIKEESSRLLKRKKGEKAVHPISCEDIDGDAASCDSLASAIDINNPHISLDCFIFV